MRGKDLHLACYYLAPRHAFAPLDSSDFWGVVSINQFNKARYLLRLPIPPPSKFLFSSGFQNWQPCLCRDIDDLVSFSFRFR